MLNIWQGLASKLFEFSNHFYWPNPLTVIFTEHRLFYTVSNESESSLIVSDSALSSIGTLKQTCFSICSGYLLKDMTAAIKYSILCVGDASDITTNSNSFCCWKFVIYFMAQVQCQDCCTLRYNTHSTTAILSILAGLLITSANQLHITDNRRWWDSHIWKHSFSVM